MLRLPFSVVVALLVNLLLFSAMQSMVRQDRVRLSDAEQIEIGNFVSMTEAPPPPASRRAEPPPKPRADEMQRISQLVDSGSGNSQTALSADFEFDFGTVAGGPAGGAMSEPTQVRMASELVPLVRFPPEYPRTALARRIEGHVDVLFTVTLTGAVTKPTVLAAEPPGIFEDAVLAAVVRWRFQPRLLNGQPVAFPARTRLYFKLDEAQE